MVTKARAAASGESGFTLVELLIVIAILGILASVVVFSVAGIQDDGQKSACQTEAATARAANEAYYAKNKAYPTAWATLTTGPNKFLSKVPTLVDYDTTHTSSNLALKWAGTTCSGISGIGNP